MTNYKRGEVVLVKFIFSDETGAKSRPALILSVDAYHKSRREAIVAAITSKVDRILEGDHLVVGWQEAGLLYPSVITGIIRTIKQGMISRRLGLMPAKDMKAFESSLRKILGL